MAGASGPSGAAQSETTERAVNVVFVGIAGPSGCGKSTLAAGLARALRSPCRPIEADHYFRPDRMPVVEGSISGELNWETPAGVDFDAVCETMDSLVVSVQEFARAAGDPAAELPPILVRNHAQRHGFDVSSKVRDCRWRGVQGGSAMTRSGDGASENSGSAGTSADVVYVVIEGFLLFYPESVVRRLGPRLWFGGCDEHTCASRRLQRSRRWTADRAEEFFRWYRDVVWRHYEEYAPTQLQNAENGGGVVLRLDATQQPEEILKHALTHPLLISSSAASALPLVPGTYRIENARSRSHLEVVSLPESSPHVAAAYVRLRRGNKAASNELTELNWDVVPCPYDERSVYIIHRETGRFLDSFYDEFREGPPKEGGVDVLIRAWVPPGERNPAQVVNEDGDNAGNLRWRLVPCPHDPTFVYIVNARHGAFVDTWGQYCWLWNNGGLSELQVVRGNTSRFAGNIRWRFSPAANLPGKGNDIANSGPKILRLLHLSDTHSMHRQIEQPPFGEMPPADILLHTGDFTNDGSIEEFANFNQWLAELRSRYKYIVVILGNHDIRAIRKAVNDGKQAAVDVLDPAYSRALLPDATHVLTHESADIEGLRIFGSSWDPWTDSGKPGVPERPAHWRVAQQENARHSFGRIPSNIDVLMTHGPPHRIFDSVGPNHTWGSSVALKEAVERSRVPLHLFGHLHEQRGVYVKQANGSYRGGVEYRASPDHKPFVTIGPPPKDYPCQLISCNAMKNHPGVERTRRQYIAGPPRLILATRVDNDERRWEFSLPIENDSEALPIRNDSEAVSKRGGKATMVSGISTGQKTIWEQVAELLPGSCLFVLTFVGSFCPVTKAHLSALIEARAMLVGEGPVGDGLVPVQSLPPGFPRPDLTVGFVSVNSDAYVGRKLKQSNGFISAVERRHLIDLAVEDQSWIETTDDAWSAADLLRECFPNLNIIRFELDGADVAIKTQSWTRAKHTDRYICIGRPPSSDGANDGTRALLRCLDHSKVDAGHFLVAPELPPVSSSKVRAAQEAGDVNRLRELLHPRVLEWLMENGRVQQAVGDDILLEEAVRVARMMGGDTLIDVQRAPSSSIICPACQSAARRLVNLAPCGHDICVACVDLEFDERPIVTEGEVEGLFACPVCHDVVFDLDQTT